MGKVFGALLVVLALWVGLEVYTEGVRGAFGGALARFAPAEGEAAAPAAGHRWAGERAADAVRRAQEESSSRRERQLGD